MTWKYSGLLPRRYLVQFQEASLFNNNNNNNNNKDLYRAHIHPAGCLRRGNKEKP